MSISPLAEIIDFFGQLSLYATVCIIVAWGPVSLYLAGGLILRLFGTSENSRVIQKGPVVVQKEPRVVRKELRVAHSGPSQEVSLGPDNVEVQATPTKETKRPRGGRNHAAGLAAYQAEIMNWHDLQIPKGYSLNVTACHIGTSATDGHAKKKKDHEDMPLRKTSREFAERVSRDMRDWSVNRRARVLQLARVVHEIEGSKAHLDWAPIAEVKAHVEHTPRWKLKKAARDAEMLGLLERSSCRSCPDFLRTTRECQQTFNYPAW